jgi:hypothetical protein
MRRPDVNLSRHHRPAARDAGWIALAALLVAGVSACGNVVTVVDAGQLGITVDAAGHPVIAVMSCGPATPVINLAEGRKPSDPEDQPNVQRGSWRARTSFAGVQQLALVEPGATWVTARGPGTLEVDRLFVVDGGTVEDDNASLVPVSFRTADLTGLAPGQIRVAGKTESLSEFGAYQCH